MEAVAPVCGGHGALTLCPSRSDAADQQPRRMPGVQRPRGLYSGGLCPQEQLQAAGCAPAVGRSGCASRASLHRGAGPEAVRTESRVRRCETQTVLLAAWS